MLKFENVAKVGDVIKSFDFKPSEGRPDFFLAGIVLDKGPIYVDLDFDGVKRKVHHCNGYTVKVVGGDSESRHRVGDIAYVPFEVSFMEHDDRVSVVSTAEEVAMLKLHLETHSIH